MTRVKLVYDGNGLGLLNFHLDKKEKDIFLNSLSNNDPSLGPVYETQKVDIKDEPEKVQVEEIGKTRE